MLGDFFRINLPYSFGRNEDFGWTAFNREYVPLGWNDQRFSEKDWKGLPISTHYKRLSQSFLEKLAGDEEFIRRDKNGMIERVFLYNDRTNPMNSKKQVDWKNYFDKIKALSRLQQMREY